MKLSIKTRHKPQEYILDLPLAGEGNNLATMREAGGFWAGSVFIPWHEIVWVEVQG